MLQGYCSQCKSDQINDALINALSFPAVQAKSSNAKSTSASAGFTDMGRFLFFKLLDFSRLGGFGVL